MHFCRTLFPLALSWNATSEQSITCADFPARNVIQFIHKLHNDGRIPPPQPVAQQPQLSISPELSKTIARGLAANYIDAQYLPIIPAGFSEFQLFLWAPGTRPRFGFPILAPLRPLLLHLGLAPVCPGRDLFVHLRLAGTDRRTGTRRLFITAAVIWSAEICALEPIEK
jgi:hypothetical protein